MKYFFVGIKGVGVVSIATLYKAWGHDVSGSDTEEEFFTDHILRDLGIPVVSFDDRHITPDIHCVIYSSAYTDAHPQIQKAQSLKIPVQSYGEALRDIFNERTGILITGTHGKTTSTAMLGRVLEDAGFDPTVIVGGELIEWGRTARAGAAKSDTWIGTRWIVAEGDEYQAKILLMKPYLLLITNIEYDHPDFYKDEHAYQEVFAALLQAMPAHHIVVAHESLRDFVEKNTKAKKIFFSMQKESFSLHVWGEHNELNALGVLAAARALGISEHGARTTLAKFCGTRRRMELYTPADADIVICDDYAHHPTEIRATLRALREQYPSKALIAVFQPHTYSRTRALFDDFARAFFDASLVILLDIYASAREQEKTVSGEDLYQATKKNKSETYYTPTCNEAYELLAQNLLQKDTVVVTLGAGDVWRIAQKLATATKALK